MLKFSQCLSEKYTLATPLKSILAAKGSEHLGPRKVSAIIIERWSLLGMAEISLYNDSWAFDFDDPVPNT